MAHPLDGCRAKLARAQETIQILRQEIAVFEQPDAPPFRITRENVENEFVFRVYGNPELPLRFSVLAGEVIHHLRSSLDHTVHALVLANKRMPTRYHQFPICSTQKQFKDACQRKQIDGVSLTARKLITNVQPYTTSTPDDTILSVVAELDNQDKHRLLVVLQAAAHIGNQLTFGADPNIPPPPNRKGGPPAITGFNLPGPQAVSPEGATVFSIQLEDHAPEFTADGSVVPVVAFERCGRSKNAPVIRMLQALSEGVANTVESFSNEFK